MFVVESDEFHIIVFNIVPPLKHLLANIKVFYLCLLPLAEINFFFVKNGAFNSCNNPKNYFCKSSDELFELLVY